jgi:hypothetical protein
MITGSFVLLIWKLVQSSVQLITKKEENIPHARNNSLCYDSKERGIVPTNYAIRTNWSDAGDYHLKSWLIETSVARRAGGKWTTRRTTSNSTAPIVLSHLQVRAGSAASSGW